MNTRLTLATAASLLFFASCGTAQIVSGVMTVTGAEMHWWAGVACDATARLYDVNEDTAVFKRLETTGKYDQGTFTFQARKDKLIDLDKLHESIWATRLSGGTRSGLVNLEVTAIGQVVSTKDQTVLRVAGSEAEFVLAKHTDAEHTLAFDLLKNSNGARKVKLTGHIADYSGKWPKVLASKPTKPRRIMVISFEALEAQ